MRLARQPCELTGNIDRKIEDVGIEERRLKIKLKDPTISWRLVWVFNPQSSFPNLQFPRVFNLLS
jgi:hypothetical protein